MSDWPEGWRPGTSAEAQNYLEAHPPGMGDEEIAAACTSLLDLETLPTKPGSSGSAEIGAPPEFPKPPEDQLEEKGAD